MKTKNAMVNSQMLVVPSYVGKKRRGSKVESFNIEKTITRKLTTSKIPRNVPQCSVSVNVHGNIKDRIIQFNKIASKNIKSDKTFGFKFFPGTRKIQVVYLNDHKKGYRFNEVIGKNNNYLRVTNTNVVNKIVKDFAVTANHAFAKIHDFTDEGFTMSFIDENEYKMLAIANRK